MQKKSKNANMYYPNFSQKIVLQMIYAKNCDYKKCSLRLYHTLLAKMREITKNPFFVIFWKKMQKITKNIIILRLFCKKSPFFIAIFCDYYIEMYMENAICDYLKWQFYAIFTAI